MRVTYFVSSLFAVSAMADLNDRFVESKGVLAKRQQFKPTTTTAEGSTCADAFGEGYVTCREAGDGKNQLCYNPNMGQTCCSNNWACPVGSFCLVSGSCCPNGQSPQACANQNGVSISSDFQVPTAAPLGTNSTIAVATGSASKSAAAAKATDVKLGSASSNRVAGAGAVGLVLGAVAML